MHLRGTKVLACPTQGRVPCALQHGEKLRLRGKGIYDVRRGSKGDMYVELQIQMPKVLTEKQVRVTRAAVVL